MTAYTSGEWHVTAGREDEFAEKWQAISDAVCAELGSGAWQVLLRDIEDHRHFRSWGHWEDEEAILRWRDGCAFGERIGELNAMLDDFETRVLRVVKTVGAFPAE